jgi:hypothetical protein
MQDYKNEQWWIELQKSLDGFDDSKMSDSDLGRWNGSKIGGKRGGEKNSKSGHMKKIQKENAHIGGKIMGPIIGKKYGINNLKKITFEDRSKGGKTSYLNHCKSGWMDEYRRLGAEASTKARIERKIEKYKSILKLITKRKFQFSDVIAACAKFGVKDPNGYAKKLLKEKSLIIQIHKGYNQFNPSIYIKNNQ